jgi:HEPN domain-containing protein
MPTSRERDYIIWQNRAVEFYLAARALHHGAMNRPVCYCAVIAVELLLKATALFFDRSFVPQHSKHNIPKLMRILASKGPTGAVIDVPDYFHFEQRYLEASRYPKDGQGLIVPATFLDDLDRTVAELILLVPFQFNSILVRVMKAGSKGGRDRLRVLARSNRQMRAIRGHLKSQLSQR